MGSHLSHRAAAGLPPIQQDSASTVGSTGPVSPRPLGHGQGGQIGADGPSSEIGNQHTDMKVAYYARTGPSSSIVLGSWPLPRPRPGEIVVRVLACSINPIDNKLRENQISISSRPLPKVPCSDYSGHVVDISMCDDSIFNVGDFVFGMCPIIGHQQGSCAEYITVKHDDVACAPTRQRPPL